MKLKLDDQGHVVVQDGKPVFVYDDGREAAFDAAGTAATISRLNAEAKGHREAKEAAEAKLKGFEGIDDADAARKALETAKNIDEGKLIAAGKVEEIKAAAAKAAEDRVAAQSKAHATEIDKLRGENGAPQQDLHLVMGSTTTNRIRGKQSTLFKVNEAGSDELLRTGALGTLQSFDLHWSPAVKTAVAVGSVTATVDGTGYAVGSTSFTLSGAAVALLAGDIITFAGDTNLYVVKTAVSGTGGTLVIQEPGIKVAMSAATKAIAVVAATTRNMFFYRGAIQLATRAPAMPDGGDSADDVMIVQDPVSGIAHEFCVYRQKRQVRYEVNLAWCCAVVQPRHLGLLIGA